MADRRQPPRKGNNFSQRGPKGPVPKRRPPHAGPGRPHARPQGPNEPKTPSGPVSDDFDRLQKILAHAGVGSRRACEELITQGRVTVNGKVVNELGTKVDPKAKIALDGQPLKLERHVYYAVHKPKGYVSTNHDPAGKPKVVDLLSEIPQRVYSVGRLDEQSTGLMLLTNDGELANKLAHPKFGVEKVYRVVVAGAPAPEVLKQLTDGVWLAEGKVRAKRVKIVGTRGQASVMEMVLAEGKNREIRRMLARLGHKVMSLTRIAVGPVGLKGLGVGEIRPLTAREIDLLRQVAAGTFVPVPFAPDRRERTPRPSRKGAPASQGQGHDQGPPRPVGDRPRGGPHVSGPRSNHGSGPVGPPPSRRPAGPPQGQGYGNDQRRPSGPPQGQGQGHDDRRPGGGRPQQGQGYGHDDRRPGGGRPSQGQGQGHGHGHDQRRPGGRPQQAQGHGPGPAGRRPPGPRGNDGPPLGPPPSMRPQTGKRPPRPTSDNDAKPTRKIIGFEAESNSGPSSGPSNRPAPRARRPAPRKAPRASLGLKRKPKPGGGDE